jgi:transcriptional regulator with XRE-family HTH domain
MAPNPSALLTEGRERVASILDELMGEARDELRQSLDRVFADLTEANVQLYIVSFRMSFRQLHANIQAALAALPATPGPEVLSADLAHDLGHISTTQAWTEYLMVRMSAAADLAAADAPWSRWVAACGADGIWLDAVARMRAELGDLPPLEPPKAKTYYVISYKWSAQQLGQFHRLALSGLASTASPSSLERVRDALGLSHTELGAMFGVSRQAATQWLLSGHVPSEREEKLATVAAVVDLLEHRLKPDRIKGVVRRPADAYHGKTMLALIKDDHHRELLETVRESFDWSAAA